MITLSYRQFGIFIKTRMYIGTRAYTCETAIFHKVKNTMSENNMMGLRHITLYSL